MRVKQAAKVSPIKAGRAITAVMTPKPPAFSPAGRLLTFVVKGISFVNGEKHKNGQLSKTARVLSFPAPLPPRLNPRLYLPRIGHIEDYYGKKELQPYPWAMMSQLAFAGLNIIFGRCGKLVVL